MTRQAIVRGLLHPNSLLAIVGLASGMIGVIGASRVVQSRVLSAERVLAARYLPREVVVAARDLAPGQRIEAGMLASRRMPRDFLPSGALATTQAGTLIGRRIDIGLRRGDPLQLSNIHSLDAPALSDVIRSGGRAVTISVDDTNSMAGLLRAGDIVDLYYSRSQGDRTVLVPLLERVEILATGEVLKGPQTAMKWSQQEGHAFATVTLHVSPDDAARVVLAQATGSLTVLLRSPMDDREPTVEMRNSKYLLTRHVGVRTGAGSVPESVELIVGGTGSIVPEVSHLSIGSAQAARSGDRS